ncbi:SEC-C metal-binding domain-containing protein [Schlesneria paludicola]
MAIEQLEVKPRVETYPGTEPYAPCPCQSGRKYKFCCNSRRR